jgi:hypothetical protein
MTNQKLLTEIERNLEIELYPWQREVLLNLGKHDNKGVVVRVPRGYGKTTLSVIYAYLMAKIYDNINIGVMTSSRVGADRFAGQLMKLTINDLTPRTYRTVQTLRNGSEIHIGYAYDFGVGKSFNVLIYDEHARINDNISYANLSSLRPSLNPRKLLFVSTPVLREYPVESGIITNKVGHFYDTWNLTDSGLGSELELFHFNGELAIRDLDEHRERMRSMLNNTQFRNDFMAEWI